MFHKAFDSTSIFFDMITLFFCEGYDVQSLLFEKKYSSLACFYELKDSVHLVQTTRKWSTNSTMLEKYWRADLNSCHR